MEEENEDAITHLSALDAVEVSFVPRGVNGKTFLILKEHDAMKLDEILKKTALKKEAEINQVMKAANLSPADQETLKAALRVLTSMGDRVPPAVMEEVSELAGVMPGDAQPDAADAGAAAAAPAAKPGEAPPAVPAVAPGAAPAPAAAAPAAPAHADPHAAAAAAHTAAAAAHQAAAGAKPIAKDAPGATAVHMEQPMPGMAIMKEDGTLDESKLEGVPDALKSTIVKLWTANKSQGDALAKITKQLDDERDARVTKEYIAKAESFKNLPGKKDELGKVLKSIALKSPESFEAIEAVLKTADALIGSGSGSPLAEIGSSVAGTNPSATADAIASSDQEYSKIEQAAVASPICKGMTKEAATTAFITKTPEGRQMYAQYSDRQKLKNAAK